MSSYEKDKAKEHMHRSGDAANEAGQHAASAAQTVGHDLRAAADQAVEAGKYVAGRLTAPVGGEEHVEVKAHRAADRTEKEAKTTYSKIKDSIGGFFGQAKETTDDAAHRAADKANRGVDKVRETRRNIHEDTPSQGEVKEKGQDALESAKDTAVQAKDAVVGGLSYVGGRLTAPVSGEEGEDKRLADKAKANVNNGADRLSNAGQETQDKAHEAKEQTKGYFSSVFGSGKREEEPKEKAKSLKDKASDAITSAEDKVKDTYDSTKAKLREAAESVEPHNDVEAIKSEGGIPCNTADLLASQSHSDHAAAMQSEAVEGKNIGATDFLSKTADAWNDGMIGEGTLGSVRAAADQAGPHSTMK